VQEDTHAETKVEAPENEKEAPMLETHTEDSEAK